MTENGTAINSFNTQLEHLTFGWTDYVLFGGLLGVSILIGIYFGFFGKKQDNTTEYLLGGKTMAFFPVSMSLIASHLSGISLLGVPSEVYLFGTQYAACVVTSFASCFLVSSVYLPVFYKLQLTSTFEYLEARFSRPVRLLASFLYTFSLITYIPLVIYVPALAFAQATEFNLHVVAPVICVVCIFYTTIGGLKAVVWSDAIQLTVTIGSLFAVLFLGISSAGGISNIWRVAGEGSRLEFWNMNPSPFVRNSFWGMSVGMVLTWTSSLGVTQGSMQRFLSVPTVKDARKALAVMAVGLVVIKWTSIFTGLAMYTKYHDCDPSSTVVSKSDQILPYYVMDVAGDIPGLPGLFLAGLVSAGLSTMSACLNTAAGTIYEDFVDPWMPESADREARAAGIMKVTVVLLGVLCVCMVFVVDELGDIFQVSLSLNGITAGAMLGLFSLGMLMPWANTKGAVVGGACSMCLMIWIIVGTQYYMARRIIVYEPLPLSTEGCPLSERFNATTTTPASIPSEDEPLALYHVSFMYYTLVGALTVMVVGTIVSFLFGPSNLQDLDRDHFPPIVRRFLPPKRYTEVFMHAIQEAKGKEKEKEDIDVYRLP
ncbi:sodium-coupled monocarboxylate transporter 2 [Orussus abietinus]|uniref:sodium-coupled monocarboxylate transporter 2 n=1 Tax=Orussus abietinus TaxID=222816 RepID=UPI000624F418|nr:sodium-coupled monocarboxylate transporter 2 [Orussus abietinus]